MTPIIYIYFLLLDPEVVAPIKIFFVMNDIIWMKYHDQWYKMFFWLSPPSMKLIPLANEFKDQVILIFLEI